MKVGFATLDITPKSPVYMAGYSRKGKSHGILDEILIGTIVLEIKNIKILWIIIDSIMLEKDFCDSLKEKIYQLYAIEMNKIFISCIHTHSAPAYFKLTWEDTIVEKELQTKLFEQCLETVNHALSHLISCTLTLKKTWIEGLYGNRNEKDGWSDKSLYVLEFVHDHQPVCQLINISVHPTILNGSNFLLSSDLLGMIRQKYQQLTGIKTFICNGATGDVSTRFYRQSSGIDELHYVSNEIIKQMQNNLKIIWKDWNISSIKSATCSYLTHSDFSKDSVTMDMLNQKSNEGMVEFFKERCQRKLALKSFDMLMPSQILQLDHLFIIALPGDVVSYFAKKIKEVLKGYEVILICYCNAYVNYLVNKEDYGKYFETYNSRCMKNEADIFIDKVIESCKTLI